MRKLRSLPRPLVRSIIRPLASCVSSFGGGRGNPYVVHRVGGAFNSKLELGAADPSLSRVSGTWLLYYSAVLGAYYGDNAGYEGHIRLLTSVNGTHWTLSPTAALAWAGTGWDDYRVETPCVVFDPDAAADRKFKMYYSGAGEVHPQGFPNYKIGLAISANGVTFTRLGSTPIIDWDDFFPAGVDGLVADPEVFFAAGFYHLYCSCYARAAGGAVLGYGVAYAYSADGITFTPVGIIFAGAAQPSLIHTGSNFEMYYTRHITSPSNELLTIPTTFNPTMGVWRSTSPDLITWTEQGSRPFEWDAGNAKEDLGIMTGVDVAYIDGKRYYSYTGWTSVDPPTDFVTPTAGGNVPASQQLLIRVGDRP